MSAENEPNCGPEPERTPPEARLPDGNNAAAASSFEEATEVPRHPPIIVQQLAVPATVALIVINVAVFGAMIISARSPALLTVANNTLIEWGADFGPLTAHDQPWRLFTAMFLHCGFLHIIINMWALWSLRAVERFFGTQRYLVLYFFSGFAGSCASLIFNPLMITAGASAALFGVMGGLFGYVTLQRHNNNTHPAYYRVQMGVLKTVALNVVLILLIPGLERAGAATGLIFGTFAGLLLAPMPIRSLPMHPYTRAVMATFGLAVLLTATAYLTQDRTQSDPHVLTYNAAKDLDEFGIQIRPILDEQQKLGDSLNGLLALPIAKVQKDSAHTLAQRADAELTKMGALELKNTAVQKIHQALVKKVEMLAKTLHAFEAYVVDPKAETRDTFRSELQKSNTATQEVDDAISAYKTEHGLNKDEAKKDATTGKEPPTPSSTEKTAPGQTY